MELEVEIREGSQARCLYCREGFSPEDPAWECPGCATPYHAECRGELDTCASPGCAGPRPSRVAIHNVRVGPARRSSSSTEGTPSTWQFSLCVGIFMLFGLTGGFMGAMRVTMHSAVPSLGNLCEQGLLGMLPGAFLAGVLWVVIRPRS